MSITAKANALDLARANGFLEVTFTFDDPSISDDDRDGPISRWEDECNDADRHGIVLGKLPNAYFVMVLLRESDDMECALKPMRGVFHAHFGCEPNLHSNDVWTSPKTSRRTACAAARALASLIRCDEHDLASRS